MDRRRFYMLIALLMLSCSLVVGQNAAAGERTDRSQLMPEALMDNVKQD